jgi:alpha-tubulin suppressor-like RCC1 family protein
MIKIKNFLALLLVLFSAYSFAQLPEPTLIGTPQKYSAKGAGATGIPTISYPLPAGKNRIVMVSMLIERDRNPANTNGPDIDSYAFAIPYPYVNGILTNHFGISYQTNTPNQFSTGGVCSYFVPNNLSGNIAITFPTMSIPNSSNDEISVMVVTYENVAGFVDERFKSLAANVTINNTDSYVNKAGNIRYKWNNPTTIPVGRVINDFLFQSAAHISTENLLSLSPGWTSIGNIVVANTPGTTNPNVSAEYTGISQIMGNFKPTNNTIPTSAINSIPQYASAHFGTHLITALLPLASPSVSGKVVTPTLNSATGTQGGGLWMNVVDKSTNKVVAVVAVDASGDFTVPNGTLVEGENYDFILSKNAGVIGGSAPAVALNSGWVTVAEGLNGTTPDGTANSIFNFTVGDIDVSGLRFAIAVGSLCTTGDCNSNTFIHTTNPNTIEYDNIVSTFHSTILKEVDGTVLAWGQAIAKDGTSDVLTPIKLNATNYPGLTGKILKFTGGSAQYTGVTSNEGDQQFAVLTEDGLFVWGKVGFLISSSIKNTTTFQKVTINGQTNGLPAGVNPTDVKMLFGSYKTLALVTCSGEAWVLSDTGTKNASGSTSSTIWHRVYKATANDGGTKGATLDNVVAVRGTSQALFALTANGELYTWGTSTYTGTSSGSGPTNRTYATLMANPASGKIPKMIGMTDIYTNAKLTYFVLMTDGTVYSMGDSSFKQLGTGSTVTSSSWVQVKKSNAANDFMTDIAWFSPQEHGGDSWSANISALTTTGKLYSWGGNSGVMIGGVTANIGYSPWELGNRGLASTDIILAVETGGHTTISIKNCTTKFGYLGHKTHGSMGDGSTVAYETVFNFTDTYPINVCGAPTAPRVIDLKKCASATQNLVNAEPANLSTSGYNIQWYLADGVTPVPNTTAVGTGSYVAKYIPDPAQPTLCSGMTTTIKVTDYISTDPEFASCAAPVCFNDPSLTGTGADTKVGITLLKRAGAQNADNWPMVRKSGHIALESNTQGFVVTRMTTVQLDAIKTADNAVEGMMSYDTDAKCLKIYDGTDWKCFNTPSCP